MKSEEATRKKLEEKRKRYEEAEDCEEYMEIASDIIMLEWQLDINQEIEDPIKKFLFVKR